MTLISRLLLWKRTKPDQTQTGTSEARDYWRREVAAERKRRGVSNKSNQ